MHPHCPYSVEGKILRNEALSLYWQMHSLSSRLHDSRYLGRNSLS